MTVDIQLQAMPTIVMDLKAYDSPPTYATGLDVTQPYDPSFRWSALTHEGSIDVQVRGICAAAAENASDIQQISLIVPTVQDAVFQRGARVGISQPTLVEMGGTTFSRPPLSRGRPDHDAAVAGYGACLIVGDHEGYHALGEMVSRVLRTGKPNAQHAIVRVNVGTIFAIGRRMDNGDRTIVVYRIDDLVTPPIWFFDQLDKYEAANPQGKKRLKPSARSPMAINASMISLRLISEQDGARGWDRPSPTGDGEPMDTSYIIEGVLRKLGSSNTMPSFVELFYSIPVPRKKQAWQVAAGQETQTRHVDPADFVRVLIEETSSYRKTLLDAGEDAGKRPVPLTSELSYLPNSMDVQVVVTLPRRFSEASVSTIAAMQIVTVLPNGDIPEDFAPHCHIVGGAIERNYLHEHVLGDLTEDRAKEIYLLSHI